MEIVCLISYIVLFITYLLKPQINQEKKNILQQIILTIVLLFCYNIVVCYILNTLNIKITSITLTIINFLWSIIFSYYIYKQKKIQKYYVDKKDIVAIVIILIISIAIVIKQFGIDLETNYTITDAAMHYSSSREFYENNSLLNKTQNTATSKFMMPGAYINCGILFKIFAKISGEEFLLQIFNIFNISLFILSMQIFYFSIKKYAKNTIQFTLCIIITMFYSLGYLLNTLLFGYTYFILGILIINAIILFLQEEPIEKKQGKYQLFLLTFGLFFSYYVIAPSIYIGMLIYYIVKTQKAKIGIKQMLIYTIITLVIPVLCGSIYHFIPTIITSTHGPIDIVKINGYIYNPCISNFIFFIPFITYYIYNCIKKSENQFIIWILLLQILYIAILYILKGLEYVSEYYIAKNYFVLWMISWITVFSAIVSIGNTHKILKRICYGIIICYLIIFIIAIINTKQSLEEINFNINTNKKTYQIMDVYVVNKILLEYEPKILGKEKVDLVQFCNKQLNLTDNEILIISPIGSAYWFSAISGYKDMDEKQLAFTEIDIMNWIMGTRYEYAIFMEIPEQYMNFDKEEITKDKEILYSNKEGIVLKNLNM